MRKWLLIQLIAILMLGVSEVSAQRNFSEGSKPSFMDRIYFGGGFGAQFGNITYIDISPAIGYMITRQLSGGVGISYRYYHNKYLDYKTNIYGGRVFIRQNFSVMKLPLFLYAEYENLNYEYVVGQTQDGFITKREWIPGILLGGGLFQQIGNKAGFTVMILYNVIYDESRTPYNNPVIRAGFTF